MLDEYQYKSYIHKGPLHEILRQALNTDYVYITQHVWCRIYSPIVLMTIVLRDIFINYWPN